MFNIIISILMIIVSAFTPNMAKENGDYDVFNNNGLHLFINDNGTPNDYCDDWVYDWEDNRDAKILIFD